MVILYHDDYDYANKIDLTPLDPFAVPVKLSAKKRQGLDAREL